MTPSPHDALLYAMSEAVSDHLADEGQWNDAIEYALMVAARDHLPALLNVCGDGSPVEAWCEADKLENGDSVELVFDPCDGDVRVFVVVPRVNENATDGHGYSGTSVTRQYGDPTPVSESSAEVN